MLHPACFDMNSTMHHGPPLQLDFNGTAPRITSGTATPIKQKVLSLCCTLDATAFNQKMSVLISTRCVHRLLC